MFSCVVIGKPLGKKWRPSFVAMFGGMNGVTSAVRYEQKAISFKKRCAQNTGTEAK
jgi:hypothetical protein